MLCFIEVGVFMSKFKKVRLWLLTIFAWFLAQFGVTQAQSWQIPLDKNDDDNIYLAQNKKHSIEPNNTISQVENIFNAEFEEMYHYSHRSHASHRSHYSHYSSYY